MSSATCFGCGKTICTIRTVRPPAAKWQNGGMERVLGIGGHFMRAADPVALSAWYRDCLGLDTDENGLWLQEAGPTVFATFESDTDYFGSHVQQIMLNFRVRDVDAMLAQFDELCDLLFQAAMLVAGYHKHDRGPWRKRRVKKISD